MEKIEFNKKIESIGQKIQESLDYIEGAYQLKSDMDLINQIIDFGEGETEFHTSDIERLIKENQWLKKHVEELEKVELNKSNINSFSKSLEDNCGVITEAIEDVIMIATNNDYKEAKELIKSQFLIIDNQDLDELDDFKIKLIKQKNGDSTVKRTIG